MKLSLLAFLSMAALGTTFAAQACEDCDASSPAADAMTVVRDAETGMLRAPTTDELAALRAKAKTAAASVAVTSTRSKAAAASAAQPVVRGYASGAHSARLPASLASYSVVRRQADGTLDSRCVQGEQAAEEALRAAPASAPAKRDVE